MLTLSLDASPAFATHRLDIAAVGQLYLGIIQNDKCIWCILWIFLNLPTNSYEY